MNAVNYILMKIDLVMGKNCRGVSLAIERLVADCNLKEVNLKFFL